MYPPISLASENEGEFRKPTAKAIPEGRYATIRCSSGWRDTHEEVSD